MKLSLRSLFYELIFNERCPICSKKSDYEFSPFCIDCWKSIEGFSFNRITTGNFAKNFWKYVDSLSSFGSYEGVLKEAIHCFKYAGVKRVGIKLGELLSRIQPPQIDVLIAVPVSKRKLIQRGFNQSAILSKVLSCKWNLPLNLTALIKIRETVDQASLDAMDRIENVKNAFLCKENLKNLRIALVDDVVTTGATLTECARALKKAGASEVHAITIARAV
ncbi:ComF family protein [Thermodesulfovibrio hydrogeniphilus]